ncbi:CWF19-like protein DRN1 [Nakaseomyces glabratus]|nr:CWF19-like protein DRN1 [Nakaseomyces glabratus]KTB25179.1 CWF19-like protein DRN1 [Nakaseomyces glabratus]
MKIMVANPGLENTKEALDKIQIANEKNGPFETVFLLGQNKEDTSYDLKDTNTILVTNQLKNGGTTRKSSVIILHGFGIMKLASGLVVGYITLSKNSLQQEKKSILEYFKASKEFIDVLVTNIGSKSVASHLQYKVNGNSIIDEVMKHCKPQYHLTYDADRSYHDMKPFCWGETSSDSQITRYYNLPSYSPITKSKWIVAFSIEPGKDFNEINDYKNELGTNPYLLKPALKRDRSEIEQNAHTKKTKIDSTTCHFCFSNPNVEDQMIVAIAKHSYLTLAKGPLTVPKGDMFFSGHALITPINHVAKIDKSLDNELSKEIELFESRVAKMNYKLFDCSTVVFEIQSDKAIHFHKQVIPVPKYLITKFERALDRQVHINSKRGNCKLEFEKFDGLDNEEYRKIVGRKDTNYLQFTIYETDTSKATIYISSFDITERLDLQFGRRTLAFVLNLPKRVQWNSPICQQSKEQELKEAQLYQKSFKNFDFTLE